MSAQGTGFNLELSRRKLLAAAGIGGGAVMAASLIGTGAAQTPPTLRRSPDPVPTPPVAGLHLQFGSDASSEMVVSWHTLQSVRSPRVVLGRLDGALERVVEAKETSYTDAKAGQVVHAYHAKIDRLQPDSPYLYAASHDGAAPEFGTFRTSPRGRAQFTFTSFGDQGTPTLGKKYVPPEGVTIPNPPYVNDNLGSPAAGDTTLAWSKCSRCSTFSTATSVTPISPTIGCVPGGISGRTTAAAPVNVPGCPQPVTMRTSLAMDRSDIRPTKPTSRCRNQPARRI